MPVAQYMALCLTHPEHGYYANRDPFGAAGDFTTAPEISQMFGELIGLWAAAVWRAIGSPENVRLVELGPGRGTMMLDALRTARVMPEFRAALVVHFVEINPALERVQRQAFVRTDVPVFWHGALADVPDGALIVLANEFFDALPVHQAVMCADGWHERVVKIGEDGKLHFSIDRDPIPLFDELLPRDLRAAKIGEIFEWRADQIGVGDRPAHRARERGRADHRLRPRRERDRRHAAGGRRACVRRSPGRRRARSISPRMWTFRRWRGPPKACGRACTARSRKANSCAGSASSSARRRSRRRHRPSTPPPCRRRSMRLTSTERTGMGRLIKVMAISDPKIGPLPGFET